MNDATRRALAKTKWQRSAHMPEAEAWVCDGKQGIVLAFGGVSHRVVAKRLREFAAALEIGDGT